MRLALRWRVATRVDDLTLFHFRTESTRIAL